MICVFSETNMPGEIVAAVDINTVANDVYKYNFPDTNLLNRNIQALSPKEIQKLSVNTILMSPPCQPFTRNGKYLDENDSRTDSFLYLISILDQLETIEYILMENVKGFECSTVRNIFMEKLKECGFVYQEFLLCPSTVGVPNSRLRYYCIATKNKNWSYKTKPEIMRALPKTYATPYSLDLIIEKNIEDKYLVPDKMLRKANLFDMCYKDSRRSCCVTKAYSHYVEGTGSMYTDATPEYLELCFKRANSFEVGSEEFVNALKELKIRFFTPREVLKLMSFPKTYTFPEKISRKQCYRLLGNSVNVKVISELLLILFQQ
ncbi:tRNA (cytosine(38)-C(5))-methyltransferase isoform X2 [Manduca sexta]|uniref:tRNA (cytosine(38)-C(5))-methyltransferase isoform X2 n=1 Tax=Manduca sexta TaxID=7130 RepID=UPI00188F1179|nr:tRNA (cytosine(38)-C(5))-methyltransferase isoform X2 [Manduca sexta]